MITGPSKTSSGARFFLLFIPVAFATHVFHEAGHWIIGECLGNAMTHGLNNVSPQAGHYLHASHALWVSIGGPVFSVLQAVVALLLIASHGWPYAYPWACFAAFNRAFALLLGGFGAQDEPERGRRKHCVPVAGGWDLHALLAVKTPGLPLPG